MGRYVRQNPAKSPEHKLQYAREYHAKNLEKHKQQMAAWREANPGRNAELSKAWRAQNPDYMKGYRAGLRGPYGPEDGPDWQARNRENYLETKRENTNRRRKEVFLEALFQYSEGEFPACYCCGESHHLLLCLDHIHGGGNAHRKEVKERMSLWAKKNGWPPIFRVACHSCNIGAHLNGGVCPHQGDG